MKMIGLAAMLAASAAMAGEWVPLFDGKTLNGWEGATNGYKAEDGILKCMKAGGGKIVTSKDYADFEMEFEFKLTPGANNGLGIRCKLAGDAAYDGMEIQILDDTSPQYAKLHEYQYHGSIYGVAPAKRGHQKPVGEWNHERVTAVGGKIKVELNGTVITEADLDKIEKTMDGKNHPGLHWPSGRIGFLGHGAELEFRNIRIRELNKDGSASACDTERVRNFCAAAASHLPGTPDNTPPPGFTAQFNGKDLSNWKGLVGNPLSRAKMTKEQLAEAQAKADESMRAHWKVEDGALVFDGKGQSLCTAKNYGDFEMYVTWKIPKNGDSGIYVRGSPQIQIWDPDNPHEVKNGADKGSGALWNNQKGGNRPLVRADKPIGEWNTFFIRMVGEKLTVYLNDQLVLDNVVMENYWDRKQPIFPSEQIELQNHGGPLWFKNVYIREL
jgi:hypothetical protein